MTDIERIIAANIIGNLDDNGYISRSLIEIADDVSMQTSTAIDSSTVYNVWQKVRELEPAGIAAVDLRDCLLLQLKRLPHSAAIDNATEIVNHNFDIFSKMHYDKLRAAIGLDEEQLKEALSVIKRLNPKPGSTFATGGADDDAPQHVTPDFAVDIEGDNLVLTRLSHIPELSIERTFAADTPISESHKDEAALFIRRKRSEAQSFIKVLSMRQETLYRVMQAIVKLQREFFLTGDESLIKPMILKDIKELTGYGISIISRATAGKYVSTPHGTFSLKSLFNERPKDDNDTSTHKIFAMMKRLIEEEDPKHPLSDELITQRLNKTEGIDIARRTVAKYRERLGFPVARLRKNITTTITNILMDRFIQLACRVISAISYPLLMPTYAIIIAFCTTLLHYLPGHPVYPIAITTLGITAALPITFIYMLNILKIISDPMLNDRKERTLPLIFTMLSYCFLGWYLSHIHAPAWLPAFAFGAAVLILIMTFINLKWKISGHAAGMGGLTALSIFLVYRGYCLVPGTLLPCTMVIISGIVASARLLLGRHTLGQVAAGYLLAVAILYTAMLITI